MGMEDYTGVDFEKMFDELMTKSAVKFEGNLIDYKISDEETHYVVKFYTPGFKKDELTLEVKDGRLKLNATSEIQEKMQEIKIATGVPGDVYDNILAKYQDGVLYVTIPKANYGSKNIEII